MVVAEADEDTPTRSRKVRAATSAPSWRVVPDGRADAAGRVRAGVGLRGAARAASTGRGSSCWPAAATTAATRCYAAARAGPPGRGRARRSRPARGCTRRARRALRAAGGRLVEPGCTAGPGGLDASAADLISTACSASAATAGSASRAASLAGQAARSAGAVRGRGRPAERGRRRHRGGRRGRDPGRRHRDVRDLKPGLLIDPGARHAGMVELVDIGLGPHLDAPRRQRPAGRGRGCPAAPALGGVRQVPPRRARASSRAASGSPGRPRSPSGGAIRGGAGMVRLVSRGAGRSRWSGSTGRSRSSRSSGPGPSRPGSVPRRRRRVQAWVAGPGMGTDDDDAAELLGRGARQRRAGAGRRGRADAAGRLTRDCSPARRRRCSPRMPASWRGCSARTRPTWRAAAWNTPRGPQPAWGPQSCSRGPPR